MFARSLRNRSNKKEEEAVVSESKMKEILAPFQIKSTQMISIMAVIVIFILYIATRR